MINLGRYRLGDFLPLHVEAINGSRVEASPSAAPNYTIYDSSGAAVTNAAAVKMAPHDKPTRTGWFTAEHRLGSDFSVGRYDVLIQSTISGSVYPRRYCFEIVAGGHSSGGYIGMEQVESPHASYVVGVLDSSGTPEVRKGPSV